MRAGPRPLRSPWPKNPTWRDFAARARCGACRSTGSPSSSLIKRALAIWRGCSIDRASKCIASSWPTGRLKLERLDLSRWNNDTSALRGRADLDLAYRNAGGSLEGEGRFIVRGLGGPEGEIVQGGKTSTITANLKPGRQTFYCSVPGHEQAGMTGTLTIK